MIVVADTTPFSNFIQIERLDLLRTVFGQVVIPPKVFAEVTRLERRGVDLTEFRGAPWITVQAPLFRELVEELENELDAGESEALALAREIHPTYLLIDEAAARQKALEMGLPVIGSVGTLLQAKAAGLIPAVKPLLDAMIRDAGFWINPSFYRQVLTQVGEWDVSA